MIRKELIDALMAMRLGDLRKAIAEWDADYYMEEFVCDGLKDYINSNDEYPDIDEEDEDDAYDEPNPVEITTDEGYEDGEFELDNPDEEVLAASVADDIDNGLYDIELIENMGAYSKDFIDRVRYLMD